MVPLPLLLATRRLVPPGKLTAGLAHPVGYFRLRPCDQRSEHDGSNRPATGVDHRRAHAEAFRVWRQMARVQNAA